MLVVCFDWFKSEMLRDTKSGCLGASLTRWSTPTSSTTTSRAGARVPSFVLCGRAPRSIAPCRRGERRGLARE